MKRTFNASYHLGKNKMIKNISSIGMSKNLKFKVTSEIEMKILKIIFLSFLRKTH